MRQPVEYDSEYNREEREAAIEQADDASIETETALKEGIHVSANKIVK